MLARKSWKRELPPSAGTPMAVGTVHLQACPASMKCDDKLHPTFTIQGEHGQEGNMMVFRCRLCKPHIALLQTAVQGM